MRSFDVPCDYRGELWGRVFLRVAVLFLTGSILGALIAAGPGIPRITERTDRLFLLFASGESVNDMLFLRVFLLPLAVTVLCFTTFGSLLSPAAAGAHAFLLSYMAASLKQHFGRKGLRFMLIRLMPAELIAVPALLCLCCLCSITGGSLLRFSLGGFPQQFPVYERPFYRCLARCYAMLLLAYLFERYILSGIGAGIL